MDNIPAPHKKQHRQRGLTLIEVLVALAIFSAGIMGMISLQLSVQQRIEDQKYRNIAIWKGSELIERIRVNNDELSLQAYSTAVNDNSLCDADPAPYCSDKYNGNSLAPAQICTAQQLATFDSWQVLCSDNQGERISAQVLDPSLTCSNSPCDSLSNMTLTLSWTSKAANIDPRMTETILDGSNNEVSANTEWYSVEFRP